MKMLIGLTGKTGSGKTYASEIFKELGAFVVDCDAVAHEILKDSAVKEQLVTQFSEEILDSDNSINRKALGKIVFSDMQKLSVLNSIVHSEIVRKAIQMCESSLCDICVIDGSELEASGVDKKCAHMVVMEAEESIRINRVMKRDGIDYDSALLRARAQKDYSKAAIRVRSDISPEFTRTEITKLYNTFLGEANA
jgi:dephospho-CoA kinase